jgi:uncharacterized protein (TIGR03118 family)
MVTAVTLLAAAALVANVAPAGANPPNDRFVRHDLVSDVLGAAEVHDPNLVNGWGMAQTPASPVWVAANGTNVATLYRGDGVVVKPPSIVPLVVSIPGDGPTGQVYNPTSSFVVTNGAASGPALFLFDSESGDITGWNPNVPPPPPSTQAQPAAHVDGAIFKGLALATVGTDPYLYAADFHDGQIDVFDATFHRVNLTGSFTDPHLPNGYAPFNITALDGELYVAYAVQDAAAEDEVTGQGKGIVDVYDTSGHLQRRLVNHGRLNAPWGMAIAPDGFGRFGGDLLVGNFGDGRIHAYDRHTGHFEGMLRGADGRPLEIDGLWALMFGNGTSAATTSLLFSAGPDDESHGLFGSITPPP